MVRREKIRNRGVDRRFQITEVESEGKTMPCPLQLFSTCLSKDWFLITRPKTLFSKIPFCAQAGRAQRLLFNLLHSLIVMIEYAA